MNIDLKTEKPNKETKKTGPPSTNDEFDKAYNSIIHWMWSDIRVPKEIKRLALDYRPKTSLELGCGLGRYSQFMASKKIQATGVDFSSVAIRKASIRVAVEEYKPTYLVGDVTNLNGLTEPFDVSFDVGCFHCLDKEGHRRYAKEVRRLLKPGGIHLIWALDHSPSNLILTPDYMANMFAEDFQLQEARRSRRRVLFVASHWYWFRHGERSPVLIDESKNFENP